MRNANIVGTAVTLSGIGTGDYFVIKNTYVGFADTTLKSLDIAGEVIGIGTDFVDNVYQVDTVTNHITDGVTGLGTTTFRRVTAKIAGISTITFASTKAGFSSESIDFLLLVRVLVLDGVEHLQLPSILVTLVGVRLILYQGMNLMHIMHGLVML